MATIQDIQRRTEDKMRREQKVCSDYLALASQNPGVSANALFETLAEGYRRAKDTETIRLRLPGTSQGIKLIIARNGLYKPRNAR